MSCVWMEQHLQQALPAWQMDPSDCSKVLTESMIATRTIDKHSNHLFSEHYWPTGHWAVALGSEHRVFTGRLRNGQNVIVVTIVTYDSSSWTCSGLHVELLKASFLITIIHIENFQVDSGILFSNLRKCTCTSRDMHVYLNSDRDTKLDQLVKGFKALAHAPVWPALH